MQAFDRDLTYHARPDGGELSVAPSLRAVPRPSASTSTAGSDRAAAWGLAATFAVFAYEWFLSGMNKLTSGGFRSGLAGQISDAVTNNPNHWYASFLSSVVVPHAGVFAVLTEVGEIAVSLGLLAGAIRWLTLSRLSASHVRLLDLAVIGALAGSAFMTLNYYLMSGFGIPWLHASDAFSEGLDIDGMLTIVALALLAIQVWARRSTRDAADA